MDHKNLLQLEIKNLQVQNLVCLDSFFNKPGVYEIDMGTPMKKIFNEIGGGYERTSKSASNWRSFRRSYSN